MDLSHRFFGQFKWRDSRPCFLLLYSLELGRVLLFILIIILEVLDFFHGYVCKIVKNLFFLRLLAVNELRVGQVEELHVTEMLQLCVIVLEKRSVEVLVVAWPQAHILLNHENGVAILVLVERLLIALEE